MSAQPQRVQFSVDDLYRMAETGILAADERVELLDGEILRMTPMGSRHAAVVDRLLNLLAPRLAGRAIVRCQSPVRLSDLSEPEPDLALLRPRDDFYADSHPTGKDILLLIEVADSSVGFDQSVKAPLFAAAGVPELWIADVSEERLLVHRSPSGPTYDHQKQLRSGDAISPLAFGDLSLPVADIFGS